MPMRKKKVIRFPSARSEGLLIQPVGDEWVVYDETTKEAHCLKPLAAQVFANADGQTTVDELAVRVGAKLGADVEAASVLDAVAQLEERGLMDHGGISRRDLMSKSAKVGVAAAFAAPLISSVVAPAAAVAASHTCATLLCCPCNTVVGKDCCTNNVTVNCQCTQASGGGGQKFCKPAGTGAPTPTECITPPEQPTCATCCASQTVEAGTAVACGYGTPGGTSAFCSGTIPTTC